MLRYIALAWNPDSAQANDDARVLVDAIKSSSGEWQQLKTTAGLEVFVAETNSLQNQCHPLPDLSGVVLGTLFDGARNLVDDDARRGAGIVASRGRDLVTSCWGRYVAFIAERRSHCLYVLRDPIGGLPCFYSSHGQATIFFSRMEDCVQLQLLRFSINWNYLAARVATGPFRTHQTGLNEASELQPGECLEFRQGRQVAKSFYWHPLEIAKSHPIEDTVEAAARLGSTAKACVHAWASCHTSILHRLSGGIDSSIVLGCLRDAPTHPQVTCVHYYYPHEGNPDERPYARLSAQQAGCELMEFERHAELGSFETLLQLTPSAVPLAHLAHLETNYWELPAARERQATVIFSGDGGDALFSRHGKNLVAADFVHRRGLRPQLLRLASELAALTQTSIWRILGAALRDGMFGNSLDAAEGVVACNALASTEVAQRMTKERPYLHPWFRPVDGVPPGKLLHVRLALFAAGSHYLPFGPPQAPEEIHPLHSQPLVELCLRIPTYVHFADGKERGLARKAFANELPAQVLTRFWKGRTQALPKQLLLRNMRFARELLLDGVLLREGLLDKARTEEALSQRLAPNLAASALDVFELLILEAWARRIAALPSPIAASL